MPSYIELDKQASFPSASNAGKIVLGINTSGQVTTTDSAGSTNPVGGGGTGLIIPKPIPYATRAVSDMYAGHSYNEALPGPPGTITGSWSTNMLRLTYQTSDLDFLNYNPKYFLFVYKGSKKYGKPSPGNPARVNNEKYGKYFAHPSNLSGSIGSGVISVATYTNFSASPDISNISSSFEAFTTEWSVATGSGHPTTLTGFDPKRFYYAVSESLAGVGYEFFPWPVAESGSSGQFVSVTSVRRHMKITGNNGTGPKPRVNLYVKFAIVVEDPSNPNRYIIGPMSETIKIYPAQGYFDNGVSTEKYYYAWKTRLA